MRTVRDLRCEVIMPKSDSRRTTGKYFTVILADNIKEFIEKKEYSHIVDIKIFGKDNTIVCTIIYEPLKSKPKD
ncbi:MAG: hypothetical protein WCY05_01945 [Candidatus Omnitrophota bacterium]